MRTHIEWIDASKELPDADTTVLMHMDDGEVWTGFYDDYWRFVSDDAVSAKVLHWAHFPEPPNVNTAVKPMKQYVIDTIRDLDFEIARLTTVRQGLQEQFGYVAVPAPEPQAEPVSRKPKVKVSRDR